MEKKSGKRKSTPPSLEWTEEEIAQGVIPNFPKILTTWEVTEEEIALGVIPPTKTSKKELTEDEIDWLRTFNSLKRKKGIATVRVILALIDMLLETPNR